MFRACNVEALDANIENFIYEIPRPICWRKYAKIVYKLWTICDTASVNIMIKSSQIKKSYISLIFMGFKSNQKVLYNHPKFSSLCFGTLTLVAISITIMDISNYTKLTKLKEFTSNNKCVDSLRVGRQSQ